MNNKQLSQLVGEAMIEAALQSESGLSFQEIAQRLSEKYSIDLDDVSLQRGIDDTANKYNKGS